MVKALALTIIIETVFMAACGYRTHWQLSIIVLANALTNLLLNWSFGLVGQTAVTITIGEIAVVLAEYLIFRIAFEDKSTRLKVLVLIANVLSCGLGFALLW